MRAGASFLSIGVLLGGVACATTSKTTTAKPAPAPAAPVRNKLAILTVESDSFPKAARALNHALDQAAFDGPRVEVLRPKASLEVIQLSIECVEPTSSCYAAVGNSLGARHVLLSQLSPGAKRRARQLKVAVTLFDCKRSEAIEVASATFANELAAERGIAELVAQARAAAGRIEEGGVK